MRKCSKCKSGKFESGQLRAAGGFWSKLFDVQSQKFVTITCAKCGYTEIYKDNKRRTGENILDFFTN